MIRVGLIGFGLAGQAFHAPMIRGVAGMQLACVLERRTDNAKQRYPDVRIARTLDDANDKTRTNWREMDRFHGVGTPRSVVRCPRRFIQGR